MLSHGHSLPRIIGYQMLVWNGWSLLTALVLWLESWRGGRALGRAAASAISSERGTPGGNPKPSAALAARPYASRRRDG